MYKTFDEQSKTDESIISKNQTDEFLKFSSNNTNEKLTPQSFRNIPIEFNGLNLKDLEIIQKIGNFSNRQKTPQRDMFESILKIKKQGGTRNMSLID